MPNNGGGPPHLTLRYPQCKLGGVPDGSREGGVDASNLGAVVLKGSSPQTIQ